MAVTRLTGGLTPADGGDPRTFPAIWNDTADQIETAQTDIDAVEADVLEAQADIATLQGTVATVQSDLDTLEASAITLAAGTPVDGNSIVYDTASGGWIPGEGGGGGASVTTSPTPPVGPSAGDMWWDSDNGNLYIYYDDGTTTQWVAANGPQMVVSDIAPAGYQGQLWFDSSQGQMFVYYEDVDSAQWVSANGPQVMVSEVQPDGYQGQLWFDSTQGKTYIYYDDGTSAQWVSAIGGSLAGNVIQVVNSVRSTEFSTTSLSFVDVTGLSVTVTPRSATSKFLILVSIGLTGNTGGTEMNYFTITRNGVDIKSGNSGISNQYANNNQTGYSLVMNKYDSPNTTSAITYTVRMRVNNGTGVINRIAANSFNNSESSITVLEIAG